LTASITPCELKLNGFLLILIDFTGSTKMFFKNLPLSMALMKVGCKVTAAAASFSVSW